MQLIATLRHSQERPTQLHRGRVKLPNHPEHDKEDEGHHDRYGHGAEDPETTREEHEHRNEPFPSW